LGGWFCSHCSAKKRKTAPKEPKSGKSTNEKEDKKEREAVNEERFAGESIALQFAREGVQPGS
jgi:hypothetical protein